MVDVKGVMIVMIMAVTTQRNAVILRRREVCIPVMDVWDSKLVTALAINGKIAFDMEIASAAYKALLRNNK